MKLIKRFFLVTVALTGILAACSKSDTVDNVTLTVTPTGPVVVAPGTTLPYSISASSNAALTTLGVVPTYNGAQGAAIDTTFPSNTSSTGTFTWNLPISSQSTSGETGSLAWTLTDKNGQTATTTTTFVVKTVTTDAAASLGDQQSALGSFYSTSGGGSVYLQAAANANQANVDFIFFTDPTLNFCLAAPTDAHITSTSAWTTKNATTLKTGFSVTSFATLNAPQIEAAYNSATGSGTIASGLTAGSLVAFKTIAGKYGVLMVNTVGPDATNGGNTMNITVIVEN